MESVRELTKAMTWLPETAPRNVTASWHSVVWQPGSSIWREGEGRCTNVC